MIVMAISTYDAKIQHEYETKHHGYCRGTDSAYKIEVLDTKCMYYSILEYLHSIDSLSNSSKDPYKGEACYDNQRTK